MGQKRESLPENPGMYLFKEYYDAKMALEACYQQAFEKDYDKDDIVVLMEE